MASTTDKRRQYGTGSVMRREKDGKYVGRLDAGTTATGKRRRVTVIADTERDCKKRLREKAIELATNRERAKADPNITVKAWAERWLPVHAVNVRPNTYTTDAGAVRKWIVPTLGHVKVRDLTSEHLHQLRAAIVKAGRSSTTARQAHYTLRGMLNAAVQADIYVPASVLAVDAPRKAAHDRTDIPGDEGARVLLLALQRPDAARWVISLLLGMRQAEVLGMTWPALDDRPGLLDVSWQLQSLPYLDVKDKAAGFRLPDGYETRHLVNAWHLTRPKTNSGYRVIPVLPFVTDLLERWRQVAPDNPWGLVFSTLDGAGRPMPVNPRLDRQIWADLQAEAGVRHPSGRPYVGHEMRHGTATYLLDQGVDPKVVTSIMGHSSIVTSRGYQHVSTTMAREALTAVASRLGLG